MSLTFLIHFQREQPVIQHTDYVIGHLEVLREGCFKYFELGGDRVAGPVGLLSA